MGDHVARLQAALNRRHEELGTLVELLPATAAKTARKSAVSRVVVIVAGATIAARDAIQLLLGETVQIGVSFAALGFLVAVLTGLESAFKWEGRAAELRLLGVTAKSTFQATDTAWQTRVGVEEAEDKKAAALAAILEQQDRQLTVIQERAAAAGVDVTKELAARRPPQELFPA